MKLQLTTSLKIRIPAFIWYSKTLKPAAVKYGVDVWGRYESQTRGDNGQKLNWAHVGVRGPDAAVAAFMTEAKAIIADATK